MVDVGATQRVVRVTRCFSILPPVGGVDLDSDSDSDSDVTTLVSLFIFLVLFLGRVATLPLSSCRSRKRMGSRHLLRFPSLLRCCTCVSRVQMGGLEERVHTYCRCSSNILIRSLAPTHTADTDDRHRRRHR